VGAAIEIAAQSKDSSWNHGISELFSTCNVALSCLPSNEAVVAVYTATEGEFADAHRGSLIMDTA
jgi:3-hydroxyisobutyrate dehydrogenase-like beta-hydroxyacid dehydrogenase